MKRIVPLAVLILTGLLARQTSATETRLTVSGAIPARGQFIVSVFSGAESWMKRPVQETTVPVGPAGKATVVLELPPGTYGASVVHDANSDGQINTNRLGIPTESFGFSNNARAFLGPPGFRHSSFDVGQAAKAIAIRLDRVD